MNTYELQSEPTSGDTTPTVSTIYHCSGRLDKIEELYDFYDVDGDPLFINLPVRLWCERPAFHEGIHSVRLFQNTQLEQTITWYFSEKENKYITVREYLCIDAID